MVTDFFTMKPVSQTGPDANTLDGIGIEHTMIHDLVIARGDSMFPVTAREYRKAAEAADRLAALLRKAARASVR